MLGHALQNRKRLLHAISVETMTMATKSNKATLESTVAPIVQSNEPAAATRMRDLGRAYTAGLSSRLEAAIAYRDDVEAGKATAADADAYVEWYCEGRAEPRPGFPKGTPMARESKQTFASTVRSFAHPNVLKAKETVATVIAEMRADKELKKGLSRASTQKDELGLHYAINKELARADDEDFSVLVKAPWIAKTVAKAAKTVAVAAVPVVTHEQVVAQARAAIVEQVAKLDLDEKALKARNAFFKLVGIAIPA